MLDINKTLFNDVVTKNIVIRGEEVSDTYEKRANTYTISYLQFIDNCDCVRIFESDFIKKNADAFDILVMKYKNNDNVLFNTVSLIWPFSLFRDKMEEIFALKVGETSGPIELNSAVFVVHLDSIRPNHQEPFEVEYLNIQRTLQNHKRVCLMDEYETELYQKAQTQIDLNAVELFLTTHLQSLFPYVIDDFLFYDSGDIELAYYYFNDDLVTITIHDFIEFYNTYEPRRNLNTLNDCINYIEEMVFYKCAFQDAVNRGLTNDTLYRLDVKVSERQIMLRAYDNYVLDPMIIISDQEIQATYEEQIADYEDGEYAHISWLLFGSEYDAERFVSKITESQRSDKQFSFLNDPSFVSNAQSVILKETIPYNSKEFPSYYVNAVFKMTDGAISAPWKINSKFYIIFKHSESGQRIKSLDEVRDQIVQQLKREKLVIIKDEILPKLMKKYILINKIDYDALLNSLYF